MASLDWRTASSFVVADSDWRRKVWIGGLWMLVPILGWPIALGYRKALAGRLWSGADPLLPDWEGRAVGYWWSGLGAIGVMTVGTALGAFVTGGFAVNHMDIAPKYAGTLMGVTNTAGTIPGVIGVFVSGLILECTGSWALVFQVAAGITLFGLAFFLAFSSGKRLFD